ncbi:hypothetical protein MOR12E_06250 [Methylobacterium oryzae]
MHKPALTATAVAALRTTGAPVPRIGDELERWQVGDLVFSDANLWRLAPSHGLVEDVDSR